MFDLTSVNKRPGAAATLEGVMAHLPLFSGVTPGNLDAIAGHCWAVSGPRGGALLRAGARLPGIYAVAYGSVKLALRNGGAEERVLRHVAARQTFGEASALLGRPSPYEAVALAEAKLVVIPSAPLLELIERETRFARALVTILAEGHLQLCAEMGSATLRRGAARVASYLDELASGGNLQSECAVQLPFSKTLLAARLGMKKETLSRLLRQLSAAGVIAVTRRRILILDRARLRQASGG